jgi:hypothetical protein
MHKTARLGFLALAFFLGLVAANAQTLATRGLAKMRGVVKSANTLPEEIQYWEIREREGVSINIAGQRDLPLIAALRNATGRRVVLTVERDDSPASDEAAGTPRRTDDPSLAKR